jgi:uncharacterized membrane protein
MHQSSQQGMFRNAGVLLGLGLGGFFDGIVLHQILQWHHMLSSVDFFDPATVPGLKTNTVADGLFHVGAYLLTIAGLALLWAACQRGHWGTRRQMIGLLLVGWRLWRIGQ